MEIQPEKEVRKIPVSSRIINVKDNNNIIYSFIGLWNEINLKEVRNIVDKCNSDDGLMSV